MSRKFLILSLSMGFVVVISNYLVQFPVKYLSLNKFLTYGAFTYPIAFLITDLANRKFGKYIARKLFILVLYRNNIYIFFSTNFSDLISIRIAIGSGTAFLSAQLLDVKVFDSLREKKWYVAPLASSFTGSFVDTFLFFSIAFYATGIPWFTLAIGDLIVKVLVALLMLILFRILFNTFRPV